MERIRIRVRSAPLERCWSSHKRLGWWQFLQATIDTLQGQLEVKDRQIEQQTQTITRLTDALAAAQQTAAAAQALHAGTIQQQLLSGEASTERQSQEPEQKRGWFSKLFRG